jgi:hypothetical protein
VKRKSLIIRHTVSCIIRKKYESIFSSIEFHERSEWNESLQMIAEGVSEGLFHIPEDILYVSLTTFVKLNWRKNTFIFLSNNAVLWRMGDFRFTHYVTRSWNSSVFAKFNSWNDFCIAKNITRSKQNIPHLLTSDIDVPHKTVLHSKKFK